MANTIVLQTFIKPENTYYTYLFLAMSIFKNKKFIKWAYKTANGF